MSETNTTAPVTLAKSDQNLVWLDCENLGMETDELHRFFSLQARLGLNKGTIFGPGGENHLRLNVACPRSVLAQAMDQLKAAVDALN